MNRTQQVAALLLLSAATTAAGAQRAVDTPSGTQSNNQPAGSSPSVQVARPIAQAAGGGKVVYIKSATADIRSGAAANSPVLATLKKGAGLTVIGEEGARLRVRLSNGQEGYIAKFNTTTTAPQRDETAFASNRGGARGAGESETIAAGRAHTEQQGGGLLRDDRGAGEQRAYSSARGLQPGAEKLADEGKYSQLALKQAEAMEALARKIDDSDIDAFMRDGAVTAP